MKTTSDKYGSLWSRDELVLALYLYCQIPFSKTKANNKDVISLAMILKRTPSSVARKLGNFGAFDPGLAKRGISGLAHVSKVDKEIWDKYSGNWDRLVADSESILQRANAVSLVAQEEHGDLSMNLSLPSGPSAAAREVETRLHQTFFRRSVLASYEVSCCVRRLNIAALLVASHIIPWSVREETRADPRNGLCMCSLHDRAFDRGLLGIDSALRIAISRTALRSRCAFAEIALASFNGEQVRMPKRFAPKAEYLTWHYDHVYEH
ncbi:restriction endonuclease [candidate division GN15 bacterium]|uniref:Restriction endonuclease n=1 Tax=candidate division GN15 bacterium TaxID=2072418 RepID=A0A855X3F5_9BACT|nr:MAG: restriction endonuclease [candidate division GN15 bacterium]